MDEKVVAAMRAFCIRVLSGTGSPQEVATLPEILNLILMDKHPNELCYLAEMLNKQRKKDADEIREQRSQNLKFAILFSASFFFGSVVTFFFCR